MLNKMLAPACLLLALGGCATSGGETAGNQADANSGIECNESIVTGSHMTRRRCTTAEQRRAQEEQVRQARDRLKPPVAAPAN